MGTEGSRIRNRNRRLRKKNLKRPKQPFQFDWRKYVSLGIFLYIVFHIWNSDYENILLYNNAIKTEAVVYKNARLRHGVRVSYYQFYIAGTRYEGHFTNLEVGDSIDVVYLPKNPKINRYGKAMDKYWSVMLYRKITGKTTANWESPYMTEQ